jgi:hypothetical protein
MIGSERPQADREPNFFAVARQNEQVLKNILKDLMDNFLHLTGDLDLSASVDVLLREYGGSSSRNSFQKFTISNFVVGPDKESFLDLNEGEVIISVRNIGFLSGSGRTQKYTINSDKSVTRRETLSVMLS